MLNGSQGMRAAFRRIGLNFSNDLEISSEKLTHSLLLCKTNHGHKYKTQNGKKGQEGTESPAEQQGGDTGSRKGQLV